VLPLLRLLARGRALRGGWADPLRFGAEARLSRALLAAYEARLDDLLGALDAARLPLATQIAALPQSVRGYGPVKEAAAARMHTREVELLHRWDPNRFPAPPRAAQAGQFRGIAVTAVR
jgi:indolepyruvate ferredoxin oxidoreductase